MYCSDIETAGKTLLAEFQYACQEQSFFSSSTDFNQLRAWLLNDATRKFIVLLRAIVPEADKQMSKYSNIENYDGKSWFTGQMFVSDWVPAPSLVEDKPT